MVSRWLSTLVVAAALGALPVLTAGAAAQAGPTLRTAAPTGPAAVPGEIVVGFRSGVRASERSPPPAADGRAQRNLLPPGVQLVQAVNGQTVERAIAALERRSDVRYAEPNWSYHA